MATAGRAAAERGGRQTHKCVLGHGPLYYVDARRPAQVAIFPLRPPPDQTRSPTCMSVLSLARLLHHWRWAAGCSFPGMEAMAGPSTQMSGFGVSLDAAAKGMDLLGKTMNGADVPKLWADPPRTRPAPSRGLPYAARRPGAGGRASPVGNASLAPRDREKTPSRRNSRRQATALLAPPRDVPPCFLSP